MTNSGDDDPKIGLSIIDPRFALIGLHRVRGTHFTRQSVKIDNWQSKARHGDVWYGSRTPARSSACDLRSSPTTGHSQSPLASLKGLVSQFGAYLGGHFATPVALNAAIVVLSAACASTMIFLVPRRILLVSEELIEKAEEEESGML